jgi:hypothetical protein
MRKDYLEELLNNIASFGMPLFSSAWLLHDLYVHRAHPEVIGPFVWWAVAAILAVMAASMVLNKLILSGHLLMIVPLAIVCLIVLLIWHRNSIYYHWVGLNVSPVAWELLYNRRFRA